MERSYNVIYRKLVEDDSDIVGHIAYSLYKSRKEAFIRDFKDTHNNNLPTEEDLSQFHRISCLGGSIEAYKIVADSILSNFLQKSLERAKDEIEQDAVENQAFILQSIINPIAPPSKWKQFLWGTLQSIAGAFAFALLVALFILIVKLRADQGFPFN